MPVKDELLSIWLILRLYLVTCLEGPRKTTKSLSQYSPWADGYGAGTLTTRQLHSVK